MLENDIKKVLVSHDEITEAAKKLGAQLTKDYAGKNPILVGILKGSIPFMAELVKHIDTHIEMDFMMVSSYHGGTASSGVINIKQDVTQDIKGRHVLFVEDIIDTGQTLKNLRDMFKEREAASVKIATLLDKPEGRVVEIEADYTCFTIPNEFVVGYGLDYKENYRNLPYIGVLKEEVYSNYIGVLKEEVYSN
ncbi:TPA: hypoxanthine phosphoribosyltransferase [Streptococcus pneumoniae]|nr:hypoxanthine phosphoribosyltransferase [Streptococcus pneumoniae]